MIAIVKEVLTAARPLRPVIKEKNVEINGVISKNGEITGPRPRIPGNRAEELTPDNAAIPNHATKPMWKAIFVTRG